jgi:hypothetical protein
MATCPEFFRPEWNVIYQDEKKTVWRYPVYPATAGLFGQNIHDF